MAYPLLHGIHIRGLYDDGLNDVKPPNDKQDLPNQDPPTQGHGHNATQHHTPTSVDQKPFDLLLRGRGQYNGSPIGVNEPSDIPSSSDRPTVKIEPSEHPPDVSYMSRLADELLLAITNPAQGSGGPSTTANGHLEDNVDNNASQHGTDPPRATKRPRDSDSSEAEDSSHTSSPSGGGDSGAGSGSGDGSDAIDFGADNSPRRRGPPPKKRGRAPKPLPPPLYKAFVTEMADEPAAAPARTDGEVSPNILARIKKCLDRARHPSAAETEAKAALLVAYRMMGEHRVTEADVLSQETSEEQARHAGKSVVCIRRRNDDDDGRGPTTRIMLRGFVNTLACAMHKFFDCKSFSTRYASRIEFTFYGIATNTASAVMAFEMAHNLIVEWERGKKGISTKSSYCSGVAEGLRRTAKDEKRRELERARKAEAEELAAKMREEQLQRQRELERLRQPAVEDEPEPEHEPEGPQIKEESDADTADEDSESGSQPSGKELPNIVDLGSDSGDDDEDLDADFDVSEEDGDDGSGAPGAATMLFGDVDNEINHFRMQTEMRKTTPPARPPQPKSPSPPPPPAAPERSPAPEPEPEPEPKWKSAMQLTVYRETALNIADQYLEKEKIKLKKGRRHTRAKDMKAFKEGKEDSRKIDVHRRRLEEA